MRKLTNHLELPIQTSSAINYKLINTQNRKYQKIKGEVKRFIRKNKKICGFGLELICV